VNLIGNICSTVFRVIHTSQLLFFGSRATGNICLPRRCFVFDDSASFDHEIIKCQRAPILHGGLGSRVWVITAALEIIPLAMEIPRNNPVEFLLCIPDISWLSVLDAE
jgi:hypothetical protein